VCHFPPLGLLPLLLLPCLLTEMKFTFRVSHTVLLWFRVMVMLRFLSRTPVFLAFPPPLLLITLNLPHRLGAAADALLGMVNTDSFFFFMLHMHIYLYSCSMVCRSICSISSSFPTCSQTRKTLHGYIRDCLYPADNVRTPPAV
jgi:hypothetical protein